MRPMLRFVERRLTGPLVGVEVGVFRGEHAKEILLGIPRLRRLYLVDPYIEDYWTFNPHFRAYISSAKDKALQRLTPFNNRVKWVYAPFEANLIPEKVDFVYIDGCHSYEAVKHDILEAEKIVKRGGALGGHDYYPHGIKEKQFGVGIFVREHYEQNFHHAESDWWALY